MYFLEASRYVSSVLAPVKPKEAVVEEKPVDENPADDRPAAELPKSPAYDEANNPFAQRRSEEHASAPIEITGDSPQVPIHDPKVRRLTRDAQ